MLPLKHKLLLNMSILFLQVQDRAQSPLYILLFFQAIVLKVFWTIVYKESSQGYWPTLMGKLFVLGCLLEINDHDFQDNPSTLVLSKLSWELRVLEVGSSYLGKIKLLLIKNRIIIPVLIVDILLMTGFLCKWKPTHTKIDASIPKEMNFTQ